MGSKTKNIAKSTYLYWLLKIHTLREGQTIWEKIFHMMLRLLDIQRKILFSNFCAFSEYLNFNRWFFLGFAFTPTMWLQLCHAHVYPYRNLRKFTEIIFSIGCMVWPWIALSVCQDILRLLIRFKGRIFFKFLGILRIFEL